MIRKMTPAQFSHFKVLSDSEGIVEGVYNVTQNKDLAGDVIQTGAYRDFLVALGAGQVRMPNLCWMHDWGNPTGKVLDVDELSPDSQALPQRLKDNGWGALYAKVQYNLDDDDPDGRQAYSRVKFGSVKERSIGFDIAADGGQYDAGSDTFYIRSVGMLYEVSDVLVGANPETQLMTVKSAREILAATSPQPAQASTNVPDNVTDTLLLQAKGIGYAIGAGRAANRRRR